MSIARLRDEIPRITITIRMPARTQRINPMEATMRTLNTDSSIVLSFTDGYLFSIRMSVRCAVILKALTISNRISAESKSAELYRGIDIISP
jgi:hypothetical protein